MIKMSLLTKKERLQDIYEKIGEPDSERIRYLKEKIITLDENDYNCASVAHHLIGATDIASRNVFYPMAGLWVNYSQLVFFKKDLNSQYELFDSVEEEQELRTKRGYSIYTSNPAVFAIGFGDGKIFTPSEIYDLSKRQDTDTSIIIDPVNQITDEELLWKMLANLLDEEKIVSQATYRVRPFDECLKLDEFHQATLFSNNEIYYCLDKILFGERNEITLTPLNSNNYLKFVKPYEKGLHFFAVGSKDMPHR